MNERAFGVGYQPAQDITEQQEIYERQILGELTLKHSAHLVCQYIVLNHFGAHRPLDPTLLRLGCESAFAHYLGTTGGDFNWFSTLPDTLLLTFLFVQEKSRQELCSWFSLDLEPVYHGPLDIHVELIYLLVCNHYSAQPGDPGAVVARVAAARAKQPRLLLALWQAALAGSQKDYTKAMKLSLKQFSSRNKPALDATYPSEWIAMPESVIHQTAIQSGFDLRGLPPELGSLIVTRETLSGPDIAKQAINWAAMVPASQNSELLSHVGMRSERLVDFDFIFNGHVYDYELFNLNYTGPDKRRRSFAGGQLSILPIESDWIDGLWSSVAGIDKMGFGIQCPRPEVSNVVSVTNTVDEWHRIAIAKAVGNKLALLIFIDDQEHFPALFNFMESLTVAS